MTTVNETKVKVDGSWVSLVPDATTSSKGIVQIGSGLSVSNGVISATTSFPMYAKMYLTDQNAGYLINNNAYNGTVGMMPLGIIITNADTLQKTVTIKSHYYNGVYTTFTLNINAVDCFTGVTRTIATHTGTVSAGETKNFTDSLTIYAEEIIRVYGGVLDSCTGPTIYLGGTA